MKISIVTVAYNASKTIEQTIQSVLGQTYSNIEYIVIDGGSSDGTQEIIEKYSDKIAYYSSEKDGGIYFGMNKGVEKCSGEYIGLLNADDVYYDSEVIESVVKKLLESKTDALYGDLLYVDATDLSKVVRRWISGKYDRRNFLKGWMPPHPTFFIKKSAYEKFGTFNTQFKFAADYELMLRMLFKHKLSAVYLNQTLIKMRVGGVSNSSVKNRLKANQEDREAWRINGIQPNWYTVFMKPLSKIRQYILNKFFWK